MAVPIRRRGVWGGWTWVHDRSIVMHLVAAMTVIQALVMTTVVAASLMVERGGGRTVV